MAYTLEELADLIEKSRGMGLLIREVSTGRFELVRKHYLFTDTEVIWIEIDCKEEIAKKVGKLLPKYKVMMRIVSDKFDDIRVYKDTVMIMLRSFDRGLIIKGVALVMNAPKLKIKQFKVSKEKKLEKIKKKNYLLTYIKGNGTHTYFGVSKKDFEKLCKREPCATFECVYI